MKNKLILAGTTSLIAAAALYILGYTTLNTVLSSTQVFIYPAGFFALLGFTLFFRALRSKIKSI